MFPPTNKGLSVKCKAFSHTFNIPRRKYICKDSFSLTTCSHLRWSLRPSLPANLPPALCPSVHRLLRRDLCGWPMEPRGPLSLAQRWPREEAQRREERASSRWTKGECNVLAPHESSQAHREHIRTSGFYLRFLFFFFSAPAKSRLGVKSVRCHRTTTHTVQKRFVYAFSQFTLSGSISPVCHWSVKVKGDFFDRSQPASVASWKKPSPMNAASRARERLKLKGRPSTLKLRIPLRLKMRGDLSLGVSEDTKQWADNGNGFFGVDLQHYDQ